MYELHIAYIVEVDLVFQHHHQPLSVEPHIEYGCWKGQLADSGGPLVAEHCQHILQTCFPTLQVFG